MHALRRRRAAVLAVRQARRRLNLRPARGRDGGQRHPRGRGAVAAGDVPGGTAQRHLRLRKRPACIKRCRHLLSLLVGALRQNGCFSFEAVERERTTHCPGTFVPWVYVVAERWTRLAVGVFQVDTYLSLLCGQPPLLRREELDLSLPSTFGLWNAFGLDVYFPSHRVEPWHRAGLRLAGLDMVAPQPAGAVLVEDIQACLLGAWHDIGLLHRGEADAGDGDVLVRLRALVCSATMLYHLLNLHLRAEVEAMRDNLGRPAPAAAAAGPADPVVYMALSAAAVTLWTWTLHAPPACVCAADLEAVNVAAEAAPGVLQWLQRGARLRLVFGALPVCKCNAAAWITRFAEALARGGERWELRSIAANHCLSSLGFP